MANRKISDLTALTAPVTGDLLPIVDISEAAAANRNKKITYGTFLSSVPLGTAAAPSIAFTGDSNTGIYSPGADQVAVATNGVQRINIEADGDINIDGGGVFYDATNNRLAIGTTSPGAALEINAAAATSPFIAKINTSEAARIDSSGRLLVGTSTTADFGSVIQTSQTSGLGAFEAFHYSNSTAYPFITFAKSRGASNGLNVIVQNGDPLGEIIFRGADGTNYDTAASITAYVDGEPGTSGDATDMPGRLVFSTTPDSGSSPTERMRISSSGLVSITGELTSNGKIATLVPAAVTSFSAVCNAGDQTATSLILTSSRADVFYHIQAFNGVTTECFRVEANGNTKNTNNSYGALSDAKIKENIVDATPKLVDLMQVKVRNYNLIGETTKQIGVVAQELESVFPAMVDENADRDENGNLLTTTTKGVKYSVFVPILIKALQEAVVKIESLEARLTAAGL